MSATDDLLTVEVNADEANAIVYAIARAVATEAEGAERMPIDSSGDMGRMADKFGRMARLTAVNDQLYWRKHFGRTGGEPPSVAMTRGVLLEIAAELHQRADDQRHDPDGGAYEGGPFEFGGAARTLTLAYAGANLETVGVTR